AYIFSSSCNGFFFSSRRRHTRFSRDWSSDVCSSDLVDAEEGVWLRGRQDGIDRDADIAVSAVLETDRSREAGGHLAVRLRFGGRSEERRVGKEGRCGWWPDR